MAQRKSRNSWSGADASTVLDTRFNEIFVKVQHSEQGLNTDHLKSNTVYGQNRYSAQKFFYGFAARLHLLPLFLVDNLTKPHGQIRPVFPDVMFR